MRVHVVLASARSMKALAAVRDLVVEAVLAGALVGTWEGIRAGSAAGATVTAWPVIAGVAAVATIAVALVLRAVIAAIVTVPSARAWLADLAGERRTQAAWRVVLVAAALIAIGAGVFHTTAWAHDRFRFIDSRAVGLILACVAVALAAAIGVLAVVIDRRVAPRLPRGVLEGRRALVALAAVALVLVAAPVLVVHLTVPALALAPVATASLLVALVLAAAVARLGRRRAAQAVAVVAVIGAAIGTWQLAGGADARRAIVEQGVASKRMARALWSVADGDGDRFAGPDAGGADCDDNDPDRHPRARDVPGNGIDENCTGADARATDIGARGAVRPATPAAVRPSIVLVSIDALRADHLGAYGYRRPTSPALDALAARGVRFAWAFTSCPSTRCAIPSLLTGRYASTLGTGEEREQIANLGQVLRDAGWQTAAITCCERFALARRELSGFATIDANAESVRMTRPGQSNADVVIDAALDWLGHRDRAAPFFLWIHLYEPHHPYDAPSGTDFGDRDIDRYDTEIEFADRQLARLFAELEPSTIVAVTSDHGDEFGEHGIRFHARSLYNQVIRVPLIIAGGGVTPRVVDEPVSIVDVMPTLVELAGIAGPRGMNGVSLAGALRGGPPPARPVLVELAPDAQIERDMAAAIQPPWKVIWDREANAWSVYALADPDDTTDRAGDADLPALQRLLFETIDRETCTLP